MINDTITINENSPSESTATIQTAQAEPLSIKPSIAESERFFQFLNKRFDLGIQNDLIVLIHETSPSIKGFFRGLGCAKVWNMSFKQQNAKPINSIVLSSHTLNGTQAEIYETLTHELSHYLNTLHGYKGNSNNYHTKQFKTQAEQLLLQVEKGRHGFNITSTTPEFLQMLKEFEPSPTAFKLFQDISDGKKAKKGRLLKFSCACNKIIRASKTNADGTPTRALCLYCNTEFKNDDEDTEQDD